MTPDPLLKEILDSGGLSCLVGIKESETLDAKLGPGYDLDTEAGRLELAKDVSSFANGSGGRNIIGVRTTPQPDEATDMIDALALIEQSLLSATAMIGVINQHVYPQIDGLEVSWGRWRGRVRPGFREGDARRHEEAVW